MLSGTIRDQQGQGSRLRLREQGVPVLLSGVHGTIRLWASPISAGDKRFNRVPSLFRRKAVKVSSEDGIYRRGVPLLRVPSLYRGVQKKSGVFHRTAISLTIKGGL